MADNPWPPTTAAADPSRKRAEIDAYASRVTEAGSGPFKALGKSASRPERDREVTTLSHVLKAQGELLARLRQVDEIVLHLHTRLVGDMPEDITGSPEREPRTLIEGLVINTLGHLELVDRLERRLSDLNKVLQ